MQLNYTILILSIILLAANHLSEIRSPSVHELDESTNTGDLHLHTTGLIGSQLKVNKSRPVSQYIFMLLLPNACDTETNPGPRAPKWQCGTCTKAVTWRHKAVCCDTCETWFHIQCQNMRPLIYNVMNASNLSWVCLQCGVPNFSTTIFDSTYSIDTENKF